MARRSAAGPVEAPPVPTGYRPALDGLRAVAVVLVVLFHAGLGWIPNGYVGVDVFFVLSGYLVTGLLLDEHRDTGRVDLRRFYARRVRRLLPASLLVITVTSVLAPFVIPRVQRASFVGDARASLLYVANWRFMGAATDYFADDVQRSPFLHLWSLAVEEQFYLVFPVVLVGLLWCSRRVLRRRPERLVGLALGAVAFASVLRLLGLAIVDPLAAYYASDARLYQLLLGALLALGLRHMGNRPRRFFGAMSRHGLHVLIMLVLLALRHWEASPASRGILVALMTIFVLHAIETRPTGLVAKVLGSRLPVALGRLSYAVYLWHWPIVVLLARPLGLTPVSTAVVSLGGAVVLASASGRYVEGPIRRDPRLDGLPQRVVAIGVASGLVAALVVPPVLAWDRRPVEWARPPAQLVVIPPSPSGHDPERLAAVLAEPLPSAEAVDAAVGTPPDVDGFACQPERPDTCLLVDGDGPTVLVMGDSNAEMLLPVVRSLAETEGFRLAAFVRPGCPWPLGLTWQSDDTALVDQCVTARQQAYDTMLPALEPDVVLLVQVTRDEGYRDDSFWAQTNDVVATAISDSLDAITSTGARALMVEPLPYASTDPSICLSAAALVRECAFTATDVVAPTEAAMRTQDAQRADVWSVDLDRLGCPLLPVCTAVVDGRVVYRNRFHLADAWLADNTSFVWTSLVASGAFAGWFDPA